MSRTSLTIITILVLGAASAAAETFHQNRFHLKSPHAAGYYLKNIKNFKVDTP